MLWGFLLLNCVYLRNFTFDNVHVDASRALAEVSAENGVARFVQVSALNASEDSTSKFLRTKVK
jgi:NADH dehydrogenase (ubiquinone) 1 alpha subcomplex subunit 9